MTEDERAGATAAEPVGVTSDDTVSVRRAPRFPRFIILGAGVGAIGSFVGTAAFPIDPAVGFGPTFGFLLLFFVPAGVAFGTTIAVVLDVIASRRAKTLAAERFTVEATPATAEDEQP